MLFLIEPFSVCAAFQSTALSPLNCSFLNLLIHQKFSPDYLSCVPLIPATSNLRIALEGDKKMLMSKCNTVTCALES